MSNQARRPDPPARRLPERSAGPLGLHPRAIPAHDRRNVASRQALVRRIAAEYDEMPGLRLTLAQAQRLFGLREDVCVRVLDSLVRQAILRVDDGGSFRRQAEGSSGTTGSTRR